jgi:hypothetical protein
MVSQNGGSPSRRMRPSPRMPPKKDINYTWALGSPSGHTCRDAKTHQLDSLYIVSSSGHMSRNAKMHQKLQDANSVVDNVVHPQSKAHGKDDQLQPTVRKREDLRCGNFEIVQTCTSNI